MMRKILMFIVIVGAVIYFSQAGHGRQAGETGGNMAGIGVSAVGGFMDGVNAFFKGLTKHAR